MARTNFDNVLNTTLPHEGGYVDHSKDPGGATNLGVTHGTLASWRGRPVTKAEVRALTVKDVTPIYRKMYWDKVAGDDLRYGLDMVTFDAAVNSGPSRGSKWTQRALGVATDGKIGPVTLKAQWEAEMVQVIQKACAYRLGFMQGLTIWSTFGRGWGRRVAEVEAVAVGMASDPARLATESRAADAKAKQETAASGGLTAGGGGTAALADLPAWGTAVALCVIGVIVVLLAARALHDKRRAAAYEKVAKESVT